MAKLEYDNTGRLLFTKEMKEEYTILFPTMLPVQFSMMQKMIELEGFKVEMLTTTHRGIIDTGLKYVHNDTCYPALLVIGQFIDAIQSGKYDPHKVALLITQTGGGCRASNYIHLLRKALVKAGLEYVPVISLNLSGLEKNPGFQLSIPFLIRLIYAMVYGDLIVNLANQCRPYEVEPGSTDAMVQTWCDRLVEQFMQFQGMRNKSFLRNIADITKDFAAIPVDLSTPKIKVGVVGEIYIKYSALGNNGLEQFLLQEGCEVVVPGLMDFIIFKINNRYVDVDLYGGHLAKKVVCGILQRYIEKKQRQLIDVLEGTRFRKPTPFPEIAEKVKDYLGYGNKMGEGWLLTGEMLELIDEGVPNIVCAQPFGCLPNHVVGKGMVRAIKNHHPDSNIVAIDYDPSATAINQENRIKLMLANARQRQKKGTTATAADREPVRA